MQSTAKPAMPTQSHYMDSNFDVRSHYSDSAAVVATLYSLTATTGGGGGAGGVATNTAGAPTRPTNAGAAAAVAVAHSRSASVATAGGTESTTSINTRQQPPPPPATTSSSSSTQPFHTNSLHRKPDKLSIKSRAATTPAPTAYATLQRPNGYFRSNQSLCSCNADSEIDVNPNRPLYQYSLERKTKVHTYTCEQNAQILMRMERERVQRQEREGEPMATSAPAAAVSGRLLTCGMPFATMGVKCLPSQSADYDVKVHQQHDGGHNHNKNNASFATTMPSTVANYRENDLLGSHQTYLDVDLLPVPPPPILPLNRKPSQSSTSSKATKSQQQQPPTQPQQHHHKKSTLCKSSVLNCATNCVIETTTPNKDSHSTTTKHITTTSDQHHNTSAAGFAKPVDTSHETQQRSKVAANAKHAKRKPTAAFDLLPVGVDEQQTDTDPEDNLFFCRYEPHQFMTNCGTHHHFQHRPTNTIKYNTIGPPNRSPNSTTNRPRNSSTSTNYELNRMPEPISNYPLPATTSNHYPLANTCAHLPPPNMNPSQDQHPRAFHTPKSASVHSLSDLQLPFVNSLLNFDYPHNNDFLLHHHHPQCGPPPPTTTDDHHFGVHTTCNTTTHHHLHTNLVDQHHLLMGSTELLDDEGRPGSSSTNDSFYASKFYVDPITDGSGGGGGGCKHGGDSGIYHSHGSGMNGGGGGASSQSQQDGSNNNIPWRHRQCPSVSGSSNSSSSITRCDPSRHWFAVTSILLIVTAAGVAVPLALRVKEAPYEERLMVAKQLLTAVPLIDGHNDLPWNIRKFLHNQLNDFKFDVNLTTVPPWSKSNWSHTDLYRLKAGKVSAQFWAAYVPCDAQHKDAVQLTLEQIDVIIRLTEKYSPQVVTCTSSFDIVEAHKNQQLCSLTGVEGGHSLGGSLSVLRTFYSLGVRYMTLTSTCHTPWADSSYADAPKYDVKHGGLTEFGKTIIREMNRLGMIVDLSHVSVGTMRDALAVSEAPVIFSHSSAYELCNSSRNVQDHVLALLVKNRGLVMINFYSQFLTCSENATIDNAVAHINHIKNVAGIDHVGLGAGFDGINYTPKGLEDVASYPNLFAVLLGNGWSTDELTKLAGQNFLRVLAEVEALRDRKKSEGQRPYEDILNFRLEDPFNCTSS